MMIRNLRILGLALVAAFAASAIAATAASAQQGKLTTDGPAVFLDGTDEAGTAFTYVQNVSPVECAGSTYIGEAVGGGGAIAVPATTATITPFYENKTCKYVDPGGFSHKVTVTTNGCDYVLHIGNTTGVANRYSVTLDLVCPSGKDVEMHMYVAAGNENTQMCKVTIQPQNGLAGGVLASNPVTDELTLEGTIVNIKAEKSGLCGAGMTNEARYDVAIGFKGTNEAGAATGITVTD